MTRGFLTFLTVAALSLSALVGSLTPEAAAMGAAEAAAAPAPVPEPPPAAAGSRAPSTPHAPAIRLSDAQIRNAGITLEAARVATEAGPDSSDTRGGLRLTGQVGPAGNNTAVVLSAVAGQVELVYVHIGAAISKGQPLVRIYSAELPAMQRDYLHARAAAELAQDRLTRDEALFQEGIIAESRVRESRAARQMALATRQEQRRVLLLAGYSDAEMDALTPESISSSVTLRSRNIGLLLEQPAAAGQRVEPGTVLLRIAPANTWWLELEASKQQAADIHIGDVVRVSGCPTDGRVIAVGTQLLANTQTLPVRAEMPDSAACLRPNQYVDADLQRASVADGVISVPATALVRSGDREFVFAKQGAAFRPLPVVVARRQGGQVLLSEGIPAGTLVASSGLTALKGAWLGLGTPADTTGAH